VEVRHGGGGVLRGCGFADTTFAINGDFPGHCLLLSFRILYIHQRLLALTVYLARHVPPVQTNAVFTENQEKTIKAPFSAAGTPKKMFRLEQSPLLYTQMYKRQPTV
jgi:hypothetical protein